MKRKSEKMIGIVVWMELNKMPNRRMNWSPKTEVCLITEGTPRNRFEDIDRNHHFDNNKIYKLQSI